jgi:hypothetical protein
MMKPAFFVRCLMAAAAMMFSLAASAQTTYRVVRMPQGSQSISVDSHGKVFVWSAGGKLLCSESACHAITPKLDNHHWLGINDDHTLAGYAWTGGSDYWVLRKLKGQKAELLTPGFGLHIAPDGAVVGIDREGEAIIVTDHVEVLPGLGGIGASPLAINGAHVVAGASYLPPDRDARATLWVNGEPLDLGLLPGDQGSQAYALNDAGVAVGHSYLGSQSRPVRFADGVVRAFKLPLAGDSAIAYGINNSGTIVGSITGNGSSRAGIVEGNRMIDLNDRIGSDDQARSRLWYASSINNAGQIAAIATDRQTGADAPVRLDPVQ